MGLGDKIKSMGKSAKEQAVFSALSPAMQLINGWTKDIHPENEVSRFVEGKYGILFETPGLSNLSRRSGYDKNINILQSTTSKTV